MQPTTIILLGLAVLACARTRSPDKTRPSRFQHLRGWQKIFGILALILTLLIILNPETLALGLLGDTAFVDMLVLVLSLQMSVFATRAFDSCGSVLFKMVKWLGIPSPGLRCLLAFLTIAFSGAVTAFQKAVDRIQS
jgi:uncharacterized membrane protein YkgB